MDDLTALLRWEGVRRQFLASNLAVGVAAKASVWNRLQEMVKLVKYSKGRVGAFYITRCTRDLL